MLENRKNKLGQRMLRKGADTRKKLMDATLRLLDLQSPLEISVHGIAREAGASPATFYVYFTDVKDVLFALCETILDGVHAVVTTLQVWPATRRAQCVREFLQAYHRFGEQYRKLIAVRNLESDLGDERFFDSRFRAVLPVLDALRDRILEACGSAENLTPEAAWAQAVVIVSALEQIAAHRTRTYIPERPISPESLLDAEVDVVLKLLRPIAGES